MPEKMGKFGAFFKACRLEARKGLRQFCVGNDFDPGNISRMERGVMPPPQSQALLTKYARALGIREGSDEWYTFFDLAAADKGLIPPDLLNDEEVLAQLPMVFRTMRNRKPDAKTLDALIELLRRP
jgi:transcriptional regulator with XRE-family HTH domain